MYELWTEHICVHDQVCNSVQGARDGMWYVSLGNWPESSDAVSRLRSNHRQMSGPGSPELLLTHSLTHSPSLSGADNSAAFSAQLRTEIVNTNICYGCHTIGTEQSGNEWPTRIRNGILCNMEWNCVWTIWIEVENDQKWIYRKDFFNYANQIV